MLPLGDAAQFEPWVVKLLRRALGTVHARPFMLDFDRIRGSGRTVELVRRGTNRDAVAFRALVIEALSRYVSAPWPRSFRPHVTLNYRRATPCDRLIDPISWLVEDFVLIESVTGETRHIEHGRWPLRAA